VEEGKKTLREKFQSVIEAFKAIEDEHYDLDAFRRPLEYIAQALDNTTQSDINEHSSELIIGLAARFLSFIQSQFYWYREANFEDDIDALNDRLLELEDSMEW